MALLSECIGAKGFEADTYFEMALRDAPLIPSLEGSAHINLGLTAQFCTRYFEQPESELLEPKSLVLGEVPSAENPYLIEARSSALPNVAFPQFLAAYSSLKAVANVRKFVRQISRFRDFLSDNHSPRDPADLQYTMAVGQCLAIAAYAQLVAENARLLEVPVEIISTIFHLLVVDLNAAALALASLPQIDAADRRRLKRMMTIPRTSQADWDFVSTQMDTR